MAGLFNIFGKKDDDDSQGPNSWQDRVAESAVAGILSTIAAPPNRREQALAGDLDGAFDFWFDGGACRIETGVTHWVFESGTTAAVSVTPGLRVNIKFANGRCVRVVQE